MEKQRQQEQKKAKKSKKQEAPTPFFQTYPNMLLEVLSWLTDQNAAHCDRSGTDGSETQPSVPGHPA